MSADRFVVLGLAPARSPWFTQVARWATSGQLAAEFVKAVSIEEVRVRLTSGRPFSALLLDSGMPGVDRDLLAVAADHRCVTVLVGDVGAGRALPGSGMPGVAATLPADFGPTELDVVLHDHATPIVDLARGAGELAGVTLPATPTGGWRGRTVAVTGPGGTGASTLAMALAQGLAQGMAQSTVTGPEPDAVAGVVLADLALHADQALLHDAGDVVPGVLELADAHRAGLPSVPQVHALTFDVVERGYRLLLGLRRHRDWTALRPRAVRAGIESLRRSFAVVVADIDDDLEDEAATGSTDVEDRNVLARATVDVADLVVVVAAPGVVGAHTLLRTCRVLLDAGVPADRILPVVNRMPRGRRTRHDYVATVVDLLAASHPGQQMLSPVCVPDVRTVDAAQRDGVPLPSGMVDPITVAVHRRLERLPRRSPGPVADEPVPVRVGSLGSWAEDASGRDTGWDGGREGGPP